MFTNKKIKKEDKNEILVPNWRPDQVQSQTTQASNITNFIYYALQAVCARDMESELSNGLIKGHAYSITDIKQVIGFKVSLNSFSGGVGNQ